MSVAEPQTEPEQGVDPLRVVTLVLLGAMVLAVVGLALYLVSYVREQRITAECYQGAFDDLNSSLQVSRDAARQDRAQLKDLVSALIDPAETPEQRRASLQQFVTASQAAEQDRARAPLPTRTCG